ncbi:MAG: hypothetical protein JXE07_02915 [Candidatus Aminicenantes bacterium]|nr:hypothetical protein [Candidatus Aminicenantes bacterium]
MRNRLAKMSMITGLVACLTTPAVLSCAAVTPANPPQTAEPAYLYKTTFVRAAPGKLLELIDLTKSRMDVYDASGDERPFWWRHTQGDQWDLMLLFPMGSYSEFYSKERMARRNKAAEASALPHKAFLRKLNACSAWREDILVLGPPLESMKKAFEDTAYYHIEICVALPGKQEELYKEREMENIYQVALGRPENMIFVRDQGAAWDLFTLGCYRDIMHWASSGEITKERREEAARRAGFSSPEAIGPYLRTLIDWHRDTMGVAIK